MSLDVSIIYQKPRMENYGKTHRAVLGGLAERDYEEEEETQWTAGITHNCGEIAEHIPIDYTSTLHDYVWLGKDETTDHMREILRIGITYMIDHKEHLEQWNPVNGWGSYEEFLFWLLDYWRACINNPGCKIKISR